MRKRFNFKRKAGFRKRRLFRRRRILRRNARRPGNKLVWKPSYNMPMPQEYFTKVRAKGQGYITVAGAVPQGFNSSYKWIFNGLTLNNLYQPFSGLQSAGVNQADGLNWATDPNLQPIGHVTLCNATTYRNYQVLGCKVKFTLLPDITADRCTVSMCPLAVGSGGAAPVTLTDMLAVPYCKTVQANLGENTKTISMYIDLAKFEGIDKKVFRNDSNAYCGTYSSSPTLQPGVSIIAYIVDHASPGAAMGFIVEQEWYVRYWNMFTNLLI